MNDNSMIEKKESFLKKIMNKIKSFFGITESNSFTEEYVDKKIESDYHEIDNSKDIFNDNLKVEVDTEIYVLKVKLENGEIKAIDLTDEQIDKLQKIYDEEIKEKKIKLEKLKQSA